MRQGTPLWRLPTAGREGREQEKNCRDTANRKVALLFILGGTRHPRHKHARRRSARGTSPATWSEISGSEGIYCGRIMIQLRDFIGTPEAPGMTQAHAVWDSRRLRTVCVRCALLQGGRRQLLCGISITPPGGSENGKRTGQHKMRTGSHISCPSSCTL